ncbi:TPA: hypothetical protein QDA93_002392 [Burkholderia vietnamiensis]|nr:hypothetical protein [Burkholderia vietnamiensis]
MKITDDMLTGWRKQFEAEFPMPPDCIWTGKGYAQTHHNAWRAQAYAHMWDGFVAARRTTPDREAIIEECAKVCDEYAIDRFALFKGRKPYTGRERGRADPYYDGASDGADRCAQLIRELKTITTSPRDTLIEEIAEMVDHMGEGRRLEEYVGAIRDMKGGKS